MATTAEDIRDTIGNAAVAPSDDAVAGVAGTWKLCYVVGSKGVSDGGAIKIGFPLMWTYPQFDDPAKPGYTVATCSVPEVKIIGSVQRYRYVVLTVNGTSLKEGDSIEVTYGAASVSPEGKATAQWVSYGSENPAVFEVAVAPTRGSKFIPLAESPTVRVVAGPPEVVGVFIPSYTRPGVEFEAKVVVKDHFGNALEDFSGTLGLDCTDTKASFPRQITINPSDKGKKRFSGRFFTPGVHTFSVKSIEDGIKGVSNPSDCGEGREFNLYWGDIHGHTNLSDGAAPIDFYYQAARDVTCYDFSAVTDHEYQGPHKFYDEEVSIELRPEDWELTKRKAKEYHEPGKFVTFLGYEWTGRRDGVPDTGGDMNVYFLDDDAPIFSRLDPKSASARALWQTLRERGIKALTIPHHTASGWHTLGSDLAHYDPEFEPVIEIYSMHGTSEYPGNPRPLVKDRPEGFVQNALAKGYKMGFIAGSDSHTLHLNSPNVPMGLPYLTLRFRGGLAAIMAKELTREALFEAIKARRVYATTGERILMDFRVNGHMMGEDIAVDRKATVFGRVVGTKNLASVELVRDNVVIYHAEADGVHVRFELEECCPRCESHFYYLRVVQEDGEMAWSSPIWVRFGAI